MKKDSIRVEVEERDVPAALPEFMNRVKSTLSGGVERPIREYCVETALKGAGRSGESTISQAANTLADVILTRFDSDLWLATNSFLSVQHRRNWAPRMYNYAGKFLSKSRWCKLGLEIYLVKLDTHLSSAVHTGQ